jgi:hypothetical protein
MISVRGCWPVALGLLALALLAHDARAQTERDVIAKLNESGRNAYRAYLESGFHKVFVTSPSGS